MSNGRIDDIWKKVVEIAEVQAQHTVILERNTDDLEHHILRTQLLEDQVKEAHLPLKIMKWSIATIAVVSSVFGIVQIIRELF